MTERDVRRTAHVRVKQGWNDGKRDDGRKRERESERERTKREGSGVVCASGKEQGWRRKRRGEVERIDWTSPCTFVAFSRSGFIDRGRRAKERKERSFGVH